LNNIKEMRVKLGYSLYKMSELTGLAPSYISNLERGLRHNPSKETMESIAEALGESVLAVFFSDEQKEDK
jgi:transcriptional regulator with XRE-family HTH domain